jgi:hypothetical protein
MKSIFIVLFSILITTFLFSQNYTWELKQSGVSLGGPIDVNKFNSSIVYYGSNNRIYKSTDRGESFQTLGTLIPGSSSVKSVTLKDDAPGTFVVAIESSPNDKIYKTTDDGQTWILTNDEGQMSYFGIPVTQDPTHPDTIYTMINTNFKRSTDFGSTWTTISSSFGPINAPCDIEVFPDTSIILVGDNGTGIFRSTNYGVSWSQTYSTSGEIPTISVDFQNPGVAWATKWAGGGGMLKSTNYGESWTIVPYFGTINMWGVHIQESDGNIILANSYSTSPGSWRSTDAGASWTPINIPSNGYQVLTLDSITQFAAQGNGFYKLDSPYFIPVELTSFSASVINENVILSWSTATELNNQGFDIEKSFDDKRYEKIGFVPGYGTTTESKSYNFSISNLSNQKTFYRLRQVDFDGTFEYSSSIEVEGAAPTEFSLKQNYPNPFNPTTTIGFTLPSESIVKISIYNLIGQKVAEVVNSKFSSGNHSVDFNASNLASGIYLYKIEAGSFTSVKKMQLMK